MNNERNLHEENKALIKKIHRNQVILAVLLVLMPILVFLSRHSNSLSKTGQDFPMLDPATAFIPQKNYLTNLQNLRNYFNGLEKQYPEHISAYYEQLNSGANISVHKDLRLFPASLTKLPLAIVVAKRVEDGVWKWDTIFTATPEEIDSGSGELYKTIGTTPMTVDQLLREMIVNSDNTAQNIFLDHTNAGDYAEFQQEVGLEDLFDNQGFISAKEYSRVLRVLYFSTFLDRVDSEKILQLMSQENFHDYLSQGIPNGIIFAHKYGENRDQSIFADSGVVYDDGHPFMITVILKGKDSTEASRDWAVGLMKDISIQAFNEVRD